MNYYTLSYLLLFGSIAISVFAQIKVHSAFKKASQIPNARGISGEETAKAILKAEGLPDLPVNQSQGKLSDHYNPIDKSLSLSPEVYNQKTIAALGVAAHEVGHALQHRDSYHFLTLRTGLYPLVKISSWAAPILIMISIFSQLTNLLYIGIAFFAASVLFTLITLPVEFNASSRALKVIGQMGLVGADESRQVKKVLDAAALTYVAAALTAIMELVRLILIARAND